MACSWNHIVGIILLLFEIASLTRCRYVCNEEAIPYFSVYYGKVGGRVRLVVEADSEKYEWEKDGRRLNVSKCKRGNESICRKAKLHTTEDRADLQLQDVTLEDSGKYIVQLSCPHRAIYSFEVIILTNPFLYIDCKDMVVYEGENISCICKATNTDASTSVTWIWDKIERANLEIKKFTDILTLINVSRSESGIYTCHAKDNNSVNDTSFRLEVIPKSTISANECSINKTDCLNATILAKPCLNKVNSDIDANEMGWNIRFIVGACSFLMGIISGVLICSCKRLCIKKNRNGNSIYDDVSPRAVKGEVRDRWPEKKEPTHEYDIPESGNEIYQHESGYHEMSKFRDKNENRYQ